MGSLGIIQLLLLDVINPLSVTEPVYPPNVFSGGTVVAVIEIASGVVTKVTIACGQDPLAASSRAALASWRFRANLDRARVPVIIRFRDPNLFTVGSAFRNIDIPRNLPELENLPLPIRVVEPAYPPNSTGQGSVVLRLEIDRSGSVFRVDAVKRLGDLTQACADTVHLWKFVPAVDRDGRSTASQVFAVCVFRPLILKPKQSK